MDDIRAQLQDTPFAVSNVKRTDKRRSPSPPFTTSTMQQEASRKLNMTPRRTMAIAQQLYEGVDISGEGTVGLITYMRTDSLRISDEAQAAARSFMRAATVRPIARRPPSSTRPRPGPRTPTRPSDPAASP